VEKFVERNAGNWGARRDLITRVKFALQQALEAVIEHWDRKHPIALLLTYDEFDIEAKLTYSGERLELLAAPPAVDQILMRPCLRPTRRVVRVAGSSASSSV